MNASKWVLCQCRTMTLAQNKYWTLYSRVRFKKPHSCVSEPCRL